MAYFLICRLGWHRTGPPLPSSVGPRRLQPPFERFMEPAGSQTALTCCLWQPEGRRLAPLADNMLFVPLPSLTRFRCHHTRFSHSVCLALSLSATLSLSYSLSLSLSHSLSLSFPMPLWAECAVCGKQLSTLSQISRLILYK